VDECPQSGRVNPRRDPAIADQRKVKRLLVDRAMIVDHGHGF
jgi:hypothetical protein